MFYTSCSSGGLKESALFPSDFLPPFLFRSPDYNTPPCFEKYGRQGQKEVLWQGQGLVRVCYMSMVQSINKY